VPYRVIINPESDQTFTGDVQRLATVALDEPEQLRELLRPLYPSVEVRNGVTDPDGTKRWYVYRDGHWMRSDN
jgi:hypothetical protein